MTTSVNAHAGQEINIQEQLALQLQILHQFDAFCEKHRLRYFLYAGTLLGAVRHKNYIPWDDDIDVIMPRPDYETLRLLAQKEPIGEHLLLKTPQTSPCFNAPFFKLVDDRTVGHEAYLRKDIRNGVWIDIFPLDGLPTAKEAREALICAQEQRQKLLRYACRPCNFTWNPLKLAKRVLLYAMYHHVDYRGLAAEMDEAAKAVPYDSCDDVCVTVFDARTRIFRREWFNDTVRLPFAQYEFCCPKQYHDILTAMYGDYMQLPPEEQRVMHHQYSCRWK